MPLAHCQCGQVGHTIRSCPQRGYIQHVVNGVSWVAKIILSLEKSTEMKEKKLNKIIQQVKRRTTTAKICSSKPVSVMVSCLSHL